MDKIGFLPSSYSKEEDFPRFPIFNKSEALSFLSIGKITEHHFGRGHPRGIKPKFDPIRSISFLRIRPTCEKLMDGGCLTTVDRHWTPSDGKSSLEPVVKKM